MESREWEQVQIKAFVFWANGYLGPNRPIIDLSKDLHDGLLLIYLVEALTKIKISKYNMHPNNRLLAVDNINLALAHLKTHSIPNLEAYAAADFIDGRIKTILGFLWVLLRFFAVKHNTQDHQQYKTLEEQLLAWINQMLVDYDIELKGFSPSSFIDGKIFLALVHKYDSSVINYKAEIVKYEQFDKVISAEITDSSSSNDQVLVHRGLDLIYSMMNVPYLFKAESLKSGEISERQILLYLALVEQAFQNREATDTGSENHVPNIASKLELALKEQARLKRLYEAAQAQVSELVPIEAEMIELKTKYDSMEYEKHQEKIEQMERLGYFEEKVAAYDKIASQQCQEKLQMGMESIRLKEEVEHWKAECQILTDKAALLREEFNVAQDAHAKALQEIEALNLLKVELDARHQQELDMALMGINVLSENLKQHLNHMKVWKEYLHDGYLGEKSVSNQPVHEAFASNDIQTNVAKTMSNFTTADQLEYLSESLESENKAILAITQQFQLVK